MDDGEEEKCAGVGVDVDVDVVVEMKQSAIN